MRVGKLSCAMDTPTPPRRSLTRLDGSSKEYQIAACGLFVKMQARRLFAQAEEHVPLGSFDSSLSIAFVREMCSLLARLGNLAESRA
jgi:hypothetical protein